MGWVNNGNYRMQNLVVTKSVDGSPASGYPKTYSILDAFTWNAVNYPLLTETQFAQLSDTDYGTRRSAFRDYIEDEETGITLPDDETNQSSGYDTSTCALGTPLPD